VRGIKTIGAVLAFTILVLFYLGLLVLYLALPAIAAGERRPMHPVAIGLALVVFGLMWMIVVLFAIDAAASIYGFKRPWLANDRFGIRFGSPMFRKPLSAITGVVISYLLTLYNFGVVYLAISVHDPNAFRPQLAIGSALYFSVVTAATVGYGDIVPVAASARFAVVAEILFSFAYVVVLFSVIAGLAWRRKENAV
jgi:voltage-gated potassium channel Kch